MLRRRGGFLVKRSLLFRDSHTRAHKYYVANRKLQGGALVSPGAQGGALVSPAKASIERISVKAMETLSFLK